MKNAFEKLKKISNGYRAEVDSLAEDYDLDGRQDYLYSDEIKAKRLQARNADFNGRIAQAVAKAQEAAAPEIAKLRRAAQAYITNSTDPATVQTLQALLTAGVELSDMEIDAFSKKGGYGVLRLLEKPSKGHIVAPSPEKFEQEIKGIEHHFRDIWAYRGGMASFGPGGYFGQSSAVGNAVMKGMIDKLPAKLDEMSERWSVFDTETQD